MVKLYYDPITVNCRKVLAGFKLVGLEFETMAIDYFAGEHKSDEYTAVNPNQSIPAMVDGDFTLWESNAMLQYAADKQSDAAHYPTDARSRADINRWHLWEASAWFPTCYVYIVENVVKPILGDQPDASILANESARFSQMASILDNRLAGKDFIMGRQVTIADIAVAAPMHIHSFQKLPLDDFGNVRAWIQRVEALPCWQETDVSAAVAGALGQ